MLESTCSPRPLTWHVPDLRHLRQIVEQRTATCFVPDLRAALSVPFVFYVTTGTLAFLLVVLLQ